MATRWLYAWGVSSVAFGGASLIVPLYVVHLGGDPVTLGVLAAVAAFVGVPGALVCGRIADKTGKRRGLVLSMLGLVAVMLVATALTDSVGVVIGLNGAIWFGFAAGTPVVTLLAVADAAEAEWSERIGQLNKYQGVGWALGLLLGVIWTALGARLLPAEAVLTGFIFVLGSCAVVGFLLGLRYLPSDAAVGPPPSGPQLRRALRRADRFSVRTATFPFTLARADFRGLHPDTLRERFTPALALYFGAVFVFFAGFSAFFAPLPAFLTDTGFSSNQIFLLYLINSLGAAVFFGAAGGLATKYGVTRLQVAGLVGRAIALPLVALAGLTFGTTAVGFGLLAILCALIGVTWAVIAVTAGTLVTQLAPTAIRGEALGVYAALGACAGGVGSILGGWLAASSYLVAFTSAGGLVLVGAVGVLELCRRLAVERTAVAIGSHS